MTVTYFIKFDSHTFKMNICLTIFILCMHFCVLKMCLDSMVPEPNKNDGCNKK